MHYVSHSLTASLAAVHHDRTELTGATSQVNSETQKETGAGNQLFVCSNGGAYAVATNKANRFVSALRNVHIASQIGKMVLQIQELDHIHE